MMHWLLHLTGLDSATGPIYLWWSGIGPVLATSTPMTIVAVSHLRRYNCHVRRCWRIGRHPAGVWLVCSRHSPGDSPTHAEVLRGQD